MSIIVDEYGVGGSVNPDTFAFVQIHPWAGGSTVWGGDRFDFYVPPASQGTPDAWFDGMVNNSGSMGSTTADYNRYRATFLTRQAASTDVTIELNGDLDVGQTYDITAEVCIEAGGSTKTMRIYMVQVLDYWPTSPTYHRNGFKQAAATQDITLNAEECQQIVRPFTFDGESWASQDDIKIVAWAQVPNDSGPAEVHQAAVMTWPFPALYALLVYPPDGVPEYIPPGVPTDISVSIEDASETYVPGSGLLHYRYDGGEYLTSPLTPQSRGLYWATLPAPACDDTPDFYISAEGDGGTTVYSPEDAPTSVYTTGVGTVTMILDDDFETDQGWTVEDVEPVNGSWERGVPVDEPDEALHPPRSDYDGSGQCYLTENLLGNSDVDNGPTRLISPTFDLSDTSDPLLRFAYWWWNDDQDSDPMDVDISNDNGATWVPALTITNVPPQWFQQVINIASAIDPLPLTSQMKVRFSVADVPNNSKDEGGIDAVEVFDVECALYPPCDIDGDQDVDLDDHALFADCLAGPNVTDPPGGCAEEHFLRASLDHDGDVDLEDYGVCATILPE